MGRSWLSLEGRGELGLFGVGGSAEVDRILVDIGCDGLLLGEADLERALEVLFSWARGVGLLFFREADFFLFSFF